MATKHEEQSQNEPAFRAKVTAKNKSPHPTENVPPGDAAIPPENLARIDTHRLRVKGGPRPNPTDFSISLRAKFGSDQQLLNPGERRQSMRGFEDHYTDIISSLTPSPTSALWPMRSCGPATMKWGFIPHTAPL